MLYTIDKINPMLEHAAGFTLGCHILDDCDKDTYGLEQAVAFIKGNVLSVVVMRAVVSMGVIRRRCSASCADAPCDQHLPLRSYPNPLILCISITALYSISNIICVAYIVDTVHISAGVVLKKQNQSHLRHCTYMHKTIRGTCSDIHNIRVGTNAGYQSRDSCNNNIHQILY